jgi:hypothetical protein
LFLLFRHAANNLIVFNSFRLPEPRDALFAPVVLHVVREAVDIGVPELLARHQIRRAFDDDSDFLR